MRSIYVEFKGKIYDIIPAGVELKDVSVIKERIQKTLSNYLDDGEVEIEITRLEEMGGD